MGKGRTGEDISPPAELLQANGQHKQLLKRQPPPGNRQLLITGGEVDLLVGVTHGAEIVGPADLLRQRVLQQLPAGGQPLLHRFHQ